MDAMVLRAGSTPLIARASSAHCRSSTPARTQLRTRASRRRTDTSSSDSCRWSEGATSLSASMPERDPAADLRDIDLQLDAVPTEWGDMQWHARVSAPDPTSVERVLFRFKPMSNDSGEQFMDGGWAPDVGAYVVSNPITLAGPWQAIVAVRRTGVPDDVRVGFSFLASQPWGPLIQAVAPELWGSTATSPVDETRNELPIAYTKIWVPSGDQASEASSAESADTRRELELSALTIQRSHGMPCARATDAPNKSVRRKPDETNPSGVGRLPQRDLCAVWREPMRG
jgi:hypothetical protein